MEADLRKGTGVGTLRRRFRFSAIKPNSNPTSRRDLHELRTSQDFQVGYALSLREGAGIGARSQDNRVFSVHQEAVCFTSPHEAWGVGIKGKSSRDRLMEA